MSEAEPMTWTVQRAKLAAAVRWAHEPDRTAATSAARSAFMDRFDREVDPDGVLDPVERAKRAASAKSAHFRALAMKSARVRRGLAPETAARKAVPGRIRRAVLLRDGILCRYCGDVADPLHLDHVVPWSAGGPSTIANLVVACGGCNSRKRARSLGQSGLTLLPAPAEAGHD